MSWVGSKNVLRWLSVQLVQNLKKKYENNYFLDIKTFFFVYVYAENQIWVEDFYATLQSRIKLFKSGGVRSNS